MTFYNNKSSRMDLGMYNHLMNKRIGKGVGN